MAPRVTEEQKRARKQAYNLKYKARLKRQKKLLKTTDTNNVISILEILDKVGLGELTAEQAVEQVIHTYG